jgi:hypothetical protein
LFPEVHVIDAFCASIEEELAILSLEAPPHERNLALAMIVNADDELNGTRCRIIIGFEVQFLQADAGCEQLRDALLIGPSSVPTTHLLDYLLKIISP